MREFITRGVVEPLGPLISGRDDGPMVYDRAQLREVRRCVLTELAVKTVELCESNAQHADEQHGRRHHFREFGDRRRSGGEPCDRFGQHPFFAAVEFRDNGHALWPHVSVYQCVLRRAGGWRHDRPFARRLWFGRYRQLHSLFYYFETNIAGSTQCFNASP